MAKRSMIEDFKTYEEIVHDHVIVLKDLQQAVQVNLELQEKKERVKRIRKVIRDE